MNIFEIMEKGNSSMREVTFTAWLSYLLDPLENHGIGDTFLKKFLDLANIKISNKIISDYLTNTSSQYSVDVEAEYRPNKKQEMYDSKRGAIIDIVVKLNYFDKDRKIKLDKSLVIYIEIKVNSGAVREGERQLVNYLKYLENEEIENKALIFITPDERRIKNEPGKIENEYLSVCREPCSTSWLKWKLFDSDELTEELSVIDLLRCILDEEARAFTSPITDYVKHTIKAMIFFIDNHSHFSDKSINRAYSNKDIAGYRSKIDGFDLAPKVSKFRQAMYDYLTETLKFPDDSFSLEYDLNDYQEKDYIFINLIFPKVSNTFQINFSFSIRQNPTVGLSISTIRNTKPDKDKANLIGEKRITRRIDNNEKILNCNNSTRTYLRFSAETAVPPYNNRNISKIQERCYRYIGILEEIEGYIS